MSQLVIQTRKLTMLHAYRLNNYYVPFGYKSDGFQNVITSLLYCLHSVIINANNKLYQPVRLYVLG